MSGIPKGVIQQLGIDRVRETWSWNNNAWPPNRRPFRLIEMKPEAFKKWLKDYTEQRQHTYGPSDTLEHVHMDVLAGMYESFRANQDGPLGVRLRGFDDEYIIFTAYNDSAYMCRGFLSWSPPKMTELLFLCNGWPLEGSGLKDNGGAATILKSFEEFASITYGADLPSMQARST